jgi:outer membrane immunogenic protein
MTSFSRRVLGFIVAGTIGGAAAAQDGPPPAYYPLLWQGWYAGVHLGYGEADAADGFLGGGQIGYNWQKGALVYGIEGDATWSDISYSDSFTVCAVPDGCVRARVSASIDWMMSIRGRLGYLVQPNLLAYATAGLGIVSGSASASVNVPGFRLDPISADDTQSDFVFGIGLEARLSPASTLRVEYLGYSDAEIDVIRAGVNFRFGN